jgi:hypothetical protein
MSKEKYKVNGVIRQVNDESVRITELPIRVWTQNYKEQLEQWMAGTEKAASWIQVCIFFYVINFKINILRKENSIKNIGI